jgi:hypothetical protein
MKPGRQELAYQYRHNSNNTTRIDPTTTNIIDLYLVTQAYYTEYTNWIQDTTGTMIITEDNSGHSHLDPTTMGTGDVQVVRLDKLNFNEVNYIKVDCEGYEFRVLQGAEETIKRCKPIVVIEQKPHDAYSKQYGQFAAVGLLESWGMVKLDQVRDDWIMGWSTDSTVL